MFNDRVSYLRVHHTTHSVTQLSHSFHAFPVTNYVNNYFIPCSVQQMSNRVSGILYPYLLNFYKAALSAPWFPDQSVPHPSLVDQRHSLVHPVIQQHGGHQHGVHHNTQQHLTFHVFQAHHKG